MRRGDLSQGDRAQIAARCVAGDPHLDIALDYLVTPQRVCQIGRANGIPPQRDKTICKRGHLLSGANLYRSPDGHRRCRACAITVHHPKWRRQRQ